MPATREFIRYSERDDWGERYIGLMSGDNYEKQANQLYAKNLKGKLLLAHGGMDDNVPPYNTYLVVEELIKANKDFDLVISRMHDTVTARIRFI